MAGIKVSVPLKGRPESFETNLQEKIYGTLSKLAIEFDRVENEPAVTMEDCKAIDKAFGIETIKTILLTNRQKTAFYLLCMPANKPFITKDFGAALEISRVSFADSDFLESLLQTPRGAATPLSLIADSRKNVRFIIDEELLNRDKLVCTDGTLHGFVSINTRDLLFSYMPATFHDVKSIKL